MTSITDVSSTLGEYMLRGWILTDHSCPTAGCAVPMLRSPKGKYPIVEFCANCSRTPESTQSTSSEQTTINMPTSSNSSHSQISRTSTPPTEVSDAMSLADFAPSPETEQSRRRREQSDRASSEIGKRLLKGWAMLADECPNPDCYAVPLVRPPKAGGEKDPRKECVICGSVYLAEVDWAGRERLIPASAPAPQVTSNNILSNTPGPSHVIELSSEGLSSKPAEVTETLVAGQASVSRIPNTQTAPASFPPLSSPLTALDESANALQSSLLALSTRLNVLSSSSAIDPGAIANSADAITKVTQALTHVRQLQWSETHANDIQ